MPPNDPVVGWSIYEIQSPLRCRICHEAVDSFMAECTTCGHRLNELPVIVSRVKEEGGQFISKGFGFLQMISPLLRINQFLLDDLESNDGTP